MKNHYKHILFIALLITAFSSQSCDVLNNLFLNLPLKQEIESSGNGPDISETEFFCMSDYDSYRDNIESIKNILYVSAAYLTLDSSPGLEGTNISATLKDGLGNIIFTRNLPTAKAIDYLNNPYEIVLTETETAVLNDYLAKYKEPGFADLCFSAELLVENVTDDDGPPYYLTGQVELVVEIEMEP